MVGQTASQVLQSREAKRANGASGFLVPKPSVDLARAALSPPVEGSSIWRPNAELQAMEKWLRDTFDAGGGEADLWKCWLAWVSPFRQGKQVLRNEFDALLQRAARREAELVAKAYGEGRALHNLGLAEWRYEAAQRRVAEARREHEQAQRMLSEAKQQLSSARDAVKEQAAP